MMSQNQAQAVLNSSFISVKLSGGGRLDPQVSTNLLVIVMWLNWFYIWWRATEYGFDIQDRIRKDKKLLA